MHAPYQPTAPTLADLLRSLGDVPANRVLFDPIPGTATRADLLKPKNKLCELVDGVLVEKASGQPESLLGGWLYTVMNQFVLLSNLGYATPGDGSTELSPGTVRIPDVSFFSWQRLPGRRRPKGAIPKQAPDLAVEVLSPSNSKREMARKRDEYFRSGVRLVWEIDPKKRTARVYAAANTFTTLTAADTLTGDPVLPGFAVPLADLFAELDRHG